MRRALIASAALLAIAAPAATAHNVAHASKCDSYTFALSYFPAQDVRYAVWATDTITHAVTMVQGTQRVSGAATITVPLSLPYGTYVVQGVLNYTRDGRPAKSYPDPIPLGECGTPPVPPTAPEPPATTPPPAPTPPTVTTPVVNLPPIGRPAPSCATVRKRTSSLVVLAQWGCSIKCPRKAQVMRVRDHRTGKLVWTCRTRVILRPIIPAAAG